MNNAIQDTVTAFAWYDIAASNGNLNAKRAKDVLVKKMTSDQIDKAEELVKKNPKLMKNHE